MIKLIIFDLDGVLVESKELHYLSLNKALASINEKYIISIDEHLSTYDGLSTSSKLKLLTEKKGLSHDLYNEIWKRKQKETQDIIKNTYDKDDRIIFILKKLKEKGYLIYVASNSIYSTLKLILYKKGFIEFIDFFISNEDVKHPKPSPEIYFQCMIKANTTCQETLILEDSPIGRKAAISSGAYLLPVDSPNDINLRLIEDRIREIEKMSEICNLPYTGRCNVVIPMAGEGSRFSKVGYTFPKPLIDVKGKAMIQAVVENLNIDPRTSRYIFIVRESHYERYNLSHFLNLIAPGCEIVITKGLTEGAACSVLLAESLIDNDTPLIIANSDQLVEGWNPSSFMYTMQDKTIDGGILTFENSHPKFSYAKIGDDGFVCEVAEKKPISNLATVGIYYWKKGSDFVHSAKEMIRKNIRINNEFYVCPVYNEAILLGKKIKVYPVEKMWCIGTPEDLNNYLSQKQ